MNKRECIKNQCRLLFNEQGIRNITLRDVAKSLQISYGNVTYHYPTKLHVLKELYHDMVVELTARQRPSDDKELLEYILSLPSISYLIELKYLFFSIDYTEIKRNYTALYEEIANATEVRKTKWLIILKKLNSLGVFKRELNDKELYYIMFLSGSIRTAYFQAFPFEAYDEKQYCEMVNMLLKPYLSKSSLTIYHKIMNSN